MSRVSIPPGNKEFKYKEQLYALFYELTSEVKGRDIELEEDEYINNIQTIKFSQLISYLREIIHILIKQQNDNSLAKAKFHSDPFFTDDRNYYEGIIQKLEANERLLLGKHYELMTIKELNEKRMSDYRLMEIDFLNMKDKVKYEEGRFLSNERKDHEIIIIRQENAILKKTIAELEEKRIINEEETKAKSKEIKKLKESIRQFKTEIDQMKIELHKNSNINININNNQTSKAKCASCNAYKSNEKSPREASLLKLFNIQSRPKPKSIIQYNQSQLNKSMGLNSNANLIDSFLNKVSSSRKYSKQHHNHSMNMQLDMTQRESSNAPSWYLNPKKSKATMFALLNHNQSKSPVVNSNCISSTKRNESSCRISLSKKGSGLPNKYNYKVSLNSTKG